MIESKSSTELELQQYYKRTQSGDASVLIRIETRAGHGADKPTAKLIEEFADMWTFALANLE